MSTAENQYENNSNRLNSATNHGRKAVEEGKEAASRIKDEVRQGVSDLGKAVRSVSSNLMDGANQAAHDAYDTVKAEGAKRAHELEGEIKRSPFTAIGVAFLGGVLLSSLFRR